MGVCLQVLFRTHKLEKCFLDSKLAFRTFGQDVGERYIQRIQILQAIPNVPMLQALPMLRCHALKGNRAGEWAINLTGQIRLIFTIISQELTIVQIEEVSKHYDD